ncbi:MAG: OprO/OprP family phosphate-selective porin [Geothrix sp.]|nr:OprO/OprP family phosphate-selective porin [Geothrix sp.]
MKSLLTPLMCALLAAPAFAQEKPDTDKRIAELERRLNAMSQELEAQKTGTAMPVAGEAGHFGMAPAASKVYGSKGGLSIGGYGEMLYENFDSKLQNGTYSPKANTVDFVRQILYVGYKFDERIVFNTELEFEHAKTATGSAGEVAVEFAYLDFLLNPAFNVRAGMVLVPLGFVNELHEPPTYLGAKRPGVEGTIIPTTWRENGVGVHGELPGHFTYRAYVINGLDASKFGASGIRSGRQNGSKALAESLALTGRLDWSPIPGTTFGLGAYTGNSNQSDSGEPIRTTLVEAHAEYRARGLQLRGLYTRMTNSENGLTGLAAASAVKKLGTQQWGGYLEAGYDVLGLTGSKQALIPYVRWERLNTQQDVVAGVVADLANDQTLITAGVAYKPIPQVAVKLDLTKAENRARTGRDQVSLALGYYF